MKRILLILVCCCLVSDCLAAELQVPGQYPSIQQAIDAAHDGDVVIVRPGTYDESIRFRGKAITVRASDLSGWQAMRRTTIRGSGARASCAVFDQGETPESILEGFTLSEGRGSPVPSETGSFVAGGGVLCINTSPTIRRCWISKGAAGYGAGIAMLGACQARIVSCLITDNRAYVLGGAVLIRKEVVLPAGTPFMPRRTRSSGTTLSSARGPSRGAPEAGSGPALINCTIADNATDGQPGPWPDRYDVDCWDARPLIMNTIIHGSDPSLLIADLSLVSHCCIRETHLFQGDYKNSSAIVDVAGMVNTFGGFPGFAKIPCGPMTWENFDVEYRLDAASPCVNAGDPAALEYGRFDIEGQARVMGAGIDIGADEVRPELAVTSPAPGDIWTAGSARQVRWNGLLCEGMVDLFFSADGGAIRLALAQALPNTGSYLWELPAAVDSNACVVSVVPHVADANVLLVDSGRFTIHPDSAGPAVASKWLSLGGSFRRTGLSEYQGPDAARVQWKFETAGAVVASVTVGFEGRVHIACEDGRLHTLDAEGRPLWTCALDAAAVSSPTLGPDGSLFVGSERGTLYAIDTNGKTRWTYRTGGPIHSLPAVASNGSVYVGSADGTVYALTDSGSERWRFQTKGPGIRPQGAVFASPTIGTDGSIYVAGLYDPNLYALDADSGRAKWVCRLGPSAQPNAEGRGLTPCLFASPVVAENGTIYQGLLRDPHLYAIEPQAGRIVWSVDLADPSSAGLGGQGVRLDGEVWSEPVLGPDGTFYVSTGDPYLRAIHPDGYIKWTKRLGEVGGFTLMVDRHGFVYAAGEDGYIYRVSPDGVETGRLALSGLPGFPVVAADDLLIVADSQDYSLLVTNEQNTIWAISSKALEDEP
jgi:outer membrane protein assembly factor BamB